MYIRSLTSLYFLVLLSKSLSSYDMNITNPVIINEYPRDEFDSSNRFLQGLETTTLNDRTKSIKRLNRRSKVDRMLRVVNYCEENPIPISLVPKSFNKPHNSTGQAIFTVAMSTTLMGRDAKAFASTARKSGFDGDIVVAVVSNARSDFIEVLEKMNCIVYEVDVKCGDTNEIGAHSTDCNFDLHGVKASINMIRYYLYQIWSLKYSSQSIILLSDFNDVFYQDNPFQYHTHEWYPQYQLVTYLEHHPNAVINRCRFNSMWIEQCYGTEALRKIGSNTVSCSGNTLGTRNAILVYNYLMTKQMDPVVRYGKKELIQSDKSCTSTGMDQGFHNWLLYTGGLNAYMDVKIYQHGEGAVNVMGAFWGDNKILKMNLKDWRFLKGERPHQYISNWNGDKSPVVHQLNRFLAGEMSEGYKAYLEVFQDPL